MKKLTPEELQKRKKTSKKMMRFGCLPLIVIFLIVVVISSIGKKSAQTASVNSDSATSVTKSKPNWEYSENIDKMTSKETYFAQCNSTNSVNFKPPYDGGSLFSINIRKDDKTEVIIGVTKGQFLTSIGDEILRAKFDDEQPIIFNYCSSNDGSADMIFITSPRQFLFKLKKAKKLILETSFYQEGRQLMEFDVAGLKWNH